MNQPTLTYRDEIKKEARLLMVIGGPVIVTQLLQISMSFVDTIMAGRLSPEDLAAIAVGTSVLMPVVVLCLGCMMAVTPIVAQNVGRRAFQHIGKNARQVLWLSQILALPGFLLIRNLDFVFVFMGVTEEIIPIAAGYLKAISWGMFPAFAYGALRHPTRHVHCHHWYAGKYSRQLCAHVRETRFSTTRGRGYRLCFIYCVYNYVHRHALVYCKPQAV